MQFTYHHQQLLLKQLVEAKFKFGIDLRKIIEAQPATAQFADSFQQKRETLLSILQAIKQTEEGRQYIQHIAQVTQQTANQMHSSDIRQSSYVIDCLREATSPPFASFVSNFSGLHGKVIGKEVRRMVWSRMLGMEQNRVAFHKFDNLVTPYHVKNEFKAVLQKLAFQRKILMKQNQREIGNRLMEFSLKRFQKVPHKYEVHLTLLLVDLFSSHPLNKINEIGGVYIGLLKLSDYYSEENKQGVLNNILKALELIDSETHLRANVWIANERDRTDILASLLQFRLSFGSFFLPLEAAQFLIDQTLLRQRCKFDIYIYFAMLLMILSDQLNEGRTLREVLSESKSIVSKKDVVDAYQTIYQHIPVSLWEVPQTPNILLKHMQLFEEIQPEEHEQDQGNFVVERGDSVRIGKLK